MIPRISIQGTAIADASWEAEGRLLHIRWFGWVFEITAAKITRRFKPGEFTNESKDATDLSGSPIGRDVEASDAEG